jgi:hypothetical protein
VLVRGKSLQPSLMLVSKALSLTLSGAPERLLWTRLERLAKDEHSSLLRTFVNTVAKSFIVQVPGLLDRAWVMDTSCSAQKDNQSKKKMPYKNLSLIR